MPRHGPLHRRLDLREVQELLLLLLRRTGRGEAIDTFADRADVVFASHHWPTWGKDRIVEFLSLQRDMYAYLHDQTLRMLNRGLTGPEIAETIDLPSALENARTTRDYYGLVTHNASGIYQR